MRTFLGIVLPISVLLFAGYLWNAQGSDSASGPGPRDEQGGVRAAPPPLASVTPDDVAARRVGDRNQDGDGPRDAFELAVPPHDLARDRLPSARAPASLSTATPSPATPSADVSPKSSPRSLWSRPARSPGVRPHVLCVVIEDLNREDLGCYGQALIRTPNIDRLALGGVRFTQFAGMSSGQTAQRTAFLFGDLTMVRAVGAERVVKLPQLSLPRMFAASSYSTLLLGDCSWQLADDPGQGHWRHYWGWEAPIASSQDDADARVRFATRPEYAVFDGRRVALSDDTGGTSGEPANVDVAHNSGGSAGEVAGEVLDVATRSFDQALLAQARQLTSDCGRDRPIFMLVALRLSWWRESQEILPKYVAKDWSAGEKLHASAVTAADQLVGELVKTFDSAPDRGPVATIVLGLPRERSEVELERFRASAPATTRRGGIAADQVDPLTKSSLTTRSFRPPVAVGQWPLAPAIITWPENIRAGDAEAGFTGYHDLLPTLAAMIAARQMPLGRIMGTSHWQRWQVKD